LKTTCLYLVASTTQTSFWVIAIRIGGEEALYFQSFIQKMGISLFGQKKLAVLAVTLLVLSSFTAVNLVGGAAQFNEEDVRLAYVTQETSSKVVNTWDIPQHFLDDIEQAGTYTSLPVDVEQTVVEYLKEGHDYNFLQVGFVNQTKDQNYDVLVLLSDLENPNSIEQIRHLEIIVDNLTVERANEVVPQKIGETTETCEEEWDAAVDVEDERALAKIVTTKSTVTYKIELESGPLVEIEAWTTIEGRNIFGVVLWSLTARGVFGVLVNEAVLWITDTSTYWAHGMLGWWHKNFVHSSQILYGGLFGRVNAESDFYGPIGQSAHAWAWVRVWYDGTVDGDSGT